MSWEIMMKYYVFMLNEHQNPKLWTNSSVTVALLCSTILNQKKSHITFLDSYLLFASSLAKLIS